MGSIAELFVDFGRVALGLTPFSFLVWGYVTALLLVVGPAFAQVAPKVVDPPARMMATEPVRVVAWMPLSIGVIVGLTVALFITIIAPLLMPLAAVLLGLSGYLALARLVGEAGGRWLGIAAPSPWLATAGGIVAMRVVRLIPFAGGPLHALLAWIGLAAATAMAVQAGWSWHRRRLPDVVQFRGETLIEWYPDGDPADGKPAPGTGRPVLDNIRGDEDRPPRRDDEA